MISSLSTSLLISHAFAGRPGDREINENPPLSSNIRNLIDQGFELLQSNNESREEKDTQQAEPDPTDSALEDNTRLEVLSKDLETLLGAS